MTKMDDIFVETENLHEIISKVPGEDFIDIQFDEKSNAELTDMLVIFSTPRSGSTFLSDLIYKNNICTPHEYFQPFQYMPIMASRWECILEGKLDKSKYLKNLIDFRTSIKGWLGLNLHGEHLQVFSKFEQLLPIVNFHYVHVIRNDSFSQAISYEIASQTGKWSSHFDSFGEAKYNFSGINGRLKSFGEQNNIIKAFIKYKNINCKTISYEELISQPEKTLKKYCQSHSMIH